MRNEASTTPRDLLDNLGDNLERIREHDNGGVHDPLYGITIGVGIMVAGGISYFIPNVDPHFYQIPTFIGAYFAGANVIDGAIRSRMKKWPWKNIHAWKRTLAREMNGWGEIGDAIEQHSAPESIYDFAEDALAASMNPLEVLSTVRYLSGQRTNVSGAVIPHMVLLPS